MDKNVLSNAKYNFCNAFAELYITKQLQIAEDAYDYNDNLDDGFMYKKDIICISTEKMCAIMKYYFSDTSITVQAVTKQLKANSFLCMDGSKSNRSTKKVKSVRYLHIIKTVVKDYYAYCCKL